MHRPNRGLSGFKLVSALLMIVCAGAGVALCLIARTGRATAAPSRPSLRPGPGSGFRTPERPMMRALDPRVTLLPILSAGDTLVANAPGDLPFVLPGRIEGLAGRAAGKGLAEVYVSHAHGWVDGRGGAIVSRLLLDLRNVGVLAADFLIETSERYAWLRRVSLADDRSGFLSPALLVNEASTDGPRQGVVAAVDARSGATFDVPWLGRGGHGSTIALPAMAGRIALVGTMGRILGQHRIYLYLAGSEGEFRSGAGRLHILRSRAFAGHAPFAAERGALGIQKNFPIQGEFVPIDRPTAESPAALELMGERLGSLGFERLEGLAIDSEDPSAFYVADAGGSATPGSLFSGGGATENGRLYHVVLDSTDPTRVLSIEVTLDGSQGDDLYRPSSIDTDERCVMILEDPGARGLRRSRVLRYDTRTRRLDKIAECVDLDRKFRPLPEGQGGEWGSTGIWNASDILGVDSWLLAVQARPLRVRQRGGSWGEAGQILLLRGERSPRARRPEDQ